MVKRRAQVQTTSAFMRQEPDAHAEGCNELLFGEQVDILEELPGHTGVSSSNWAKIRSLTDGYEGYVCAESLSDRITQATHRLKALSSHIYPEPDFKARPLMALSFLSPVALSEQSKNGFTLTEQGGWVFAAHFAEAAERVSDPAETALRFEGVPYLWGGRTSTGLDCSALAQLCAMAAGHACLRDSSQQQDTLGEDFKSAALQGGDFVFFKGHVGIMLDKTHIINATARHMMTCIENCEDVSNAYGGIVAVRRLLP